MPLSEQKKEVLYQYYLKNGFDNSVTSIIDGLGISHKTFFNRYTDKETSVEIACRYWQTICEKRWNKIRSHCNNEIEELLMLLFTIDKTRSTEPAYYYHTRYNRIFAEKDSFFFTAALNTLINGTRKFYFREKLNVELFTIFLLNNLFLIDVDIENRSEMLKFVLNYALTERGMELLDETPFV